MLCHSCCFDDAKVWRKNAPYNFFGHFSEMLLGQTPENRTKTKNIP